MIRLLSVLLLLQGCLHAQQEVVYYEHIGKSSGLSDPNISDLLRDDRGFLWVGTNFTGLNLYDGHEMVVFRHIERDPFSLCDDRVVSMVEDKDGILLIGTSGGISRIKPGTNRFENYTTQNGRLTSNVENYVFCDLRGNVWTRNTNGLERYDPATDRFYRHPASDSLSGSGRSAFDRTGNIWIGGNNGLICLDPAINHIRRFVPYPNIPFPAISDLNKTRVSIDRYNNIWVMTWGGGLLRFCPQTKHFEQFVWNPQRSGHTNIPFDVGETFDVEGKRTFWIAAEQGIFQMPLEPEAFPSLSKPHFLLNANSEVGILPGCQTTRLQTDQEGNLWVGTSGGGYYRYNSQQSNFRLIRLPLGDNIEKITFSSTGSALICGEEKLFVEYDTTLRPKMKRPNFSMAMDTELGNISWDVANDPESGITYIATFDGLIAWDEKKNRTRRYPYRPSDPNGLLWNKVTNVRPIGN